MSSPHDYLAPLSSLNPFSSYEDKLEFLSDHFAWRLNVHSAFNPEFMNIDYKPELFKSPIIDDRDTGALVFKHLSIFSEECLSALLARLLLSVRGRTHGLHSCWLCSCSCDYHYSRGTARRNPLPDHLRVLLLLLSHIYHDNHNNYNAVHINFFLNKSKLRWHADDEHILGNRPDILSLTLGATRRFDIRLKGTATAMHIPLVHGDILQMTGSTQSHYEHSIPPAAYTGPRVNLTLRRVVDCHCRAPTPLLQDVDYKNIMHYNSHGSTHGFAS